MGEKKEGLLEKLGECYSISTKNETLSGGDSIIFSSNRDGNYELYVVRIDNTGLRRITNTPDFHEVDPSLAPDGKKLAFTDINEKRGCPMTIDDTGCKRITEGYEPAWCSKKAK